MQTCKFYTQPLFAHNFFLLLFFKFIFLLSGKIEESSANWGLCQESQQACEYETEVKKLWGKLITTINENANFFHIFCFVKLV